MAEPAGRPSVPDAAAASLLAEALLACAGPGRVLLWGEGAGCLGPAFASRGLEVTACGASLPDEGAFDLVVAWHAFDAMDDEACARALRAVRERARRAVAVRTDAVARPGDFRGGLWIEAPAIAAGFRKHPLYLQLVPYAAREHPGREALLLLAPMGAEALAAHPPESLAAERDLHMDMLRESGRRSDAHVERYRLALGFIRPGDAVADVACGLGYGSRLLYEGSAAASVLGVDESESAIRYAAGVYGDGARVAFRRGDAQRLDFLPDASVDVLVSFETLEHLHEPGRLLDEAKRVLRPSGRLVACVPNRWVDETGEDPNPHHHHVYSWDRLKAEVGERLVVERAYAQVAGGGMTHTGSPRSLREFPVDGDPGEAEWILVVAMRDPVEAARVPYVETTFGAFSGLADFHVARFDRDYANPWLVKALVSIGFRFGGREGLLAMARRARRAAPAGSADEGAALCVEAYALLEAGEGAAGERESLCAELDRYASRPGGRPHEARWAVSNRFAEALIHLRDGRRERARRCFAACAAMDPLPFSPLLATKTVGAAWMAGLLAALDGEAGEAARLWTGAIRSAREAVRADWRNVIGEEAHPLYFGLPELAQVLTKASRCAYALGALEDAPRRPGRFWIETTRDLESATAREIAGLRHAVSTLERQAAETGAAREAVAGRHAAHLEERIAGLREEIERRDAALAEQAGTIGSMREGFAAQERNIAELRESLAALSGEREALAARLAAQAAGIEAQRAAFDEQEAQIARLRDEARERERVIAHRDATVAKLVSEAEGRDRALAEQAGTIAGLVAEVGARDRALGEQSRTIAGMNEAFEEQARTIAGMREAFEEQARNIAGLREAFDRQADHLASLQARLATTERERSEREALAARLEGELGRANARLAGIRASWPYRLLRRWMGDGEGR